MQIANRTGRAVTGIEHIGSAHNDAELGLLLQKAEEELRPGQQAFELGDLEKVVVRTTDIANFTAPDPDQNNAEETPKLVNATGRSSLHQRIFSGKRLKPPTNGLGLMLLVMKRSRPSCWRG